MISLGVRACTVDFPHTYQSAEPRALRGSSSHCATPSSNNLTLISKQLVTGGGRVAYGFIVLQ